METEDTKGMGNKGTVHPYPHLLQHLITAALKAGAAVLDIYDAPIDVRQKSDESPVTAADEAAEAIILSELTQVAPDIPVVAEESVAAGHVPDVEETFFLVDPVDGTKEFIAKNGEFTVNIALVFRARPVLGVIFAPAKGWLFYGDVDDGAFRADISDARRDSRLRDIEEMVVCCGQQGLVLLGSRSHKSQSDAQFIAPYNIAERKAIGSSLKFCLLAAGEADLYPRFGRTMEWDIAAGDAILSAAGGKVVNPDGSLFQYGKTIQDDAPFANGHFIAVGGVDLTKGLNALQERSEPDI